MNENNNESFKFEKISENVKFVEISQRNRPI